MASLIGEADGAVSEQTAARMAISCLRRAEALSPDSDSPLAGVACTAALVTDRERRGRDRACLAVATRAGEETWAVDLDKVSAVRADTGRIAQDRLVADYLLAAIARATGAPFIGER